MSAQASTSPPPFDAPPLALGDAPAVGFGQAQVIAPAIAAPGPWKIALATSVLGAMTGWVLDEITQSVRGRRRQR